jgi:hypothetical protein
MGGRYLSCLRPCLRGFGLPNQLGTYRLPTICWGSGGLDLSTGHHTSTHHVNREEETERIQTSTETDRQIDREIQSMILAYDMHIDED